jgi:preprotein translocase subunit YajC
MQLLAQISSCPLPLHPFQFIVIRRQQQQQQQQQQQHDVPVPERHRMKA